MEDLASPEPEFTDAPNDREPEKSSTGATPLNRSAARLLVIAAELIGGGSLLLFGVFLFFGPVAAVHLNLGQGDALIWNALLSLLFFAQHSLMVRTWFKDWLAAHAPREFHAAVYAFASGVALAGAMLLWQPAPVIAAAPDPWRWFLRALAGLAIAGFVWGTYSLRAFDTFGRRPIAARLRGEALPRPEFLVRGPYVWVRHPLMSFMILLIWAARPDLGADRILFNVLWTVWMVFGLWLEERDLLREFGERYREYQRLVPMLVPWRGAAGKRLVVPARAG